MLFYVALGVAAITAVAWVVATGFNITVLERVVTVLVFIDVLGDVQVVVLLES